jgi:thiol-disulfide isomerase/thioredoxin
VSAFVSTRWARRLEFFGASVGAVIGLGLLLVQALVLKAFCPFCVVVDSCAILAFLAMGGARIREQRDVRSNVLHPSALLALGFVAAAVPAVWPYFRAAAPIPLQLSEFQVPNRVTVVEFVDLDCEHCRALYPTLESLEKDQAGAIHVVRLHVPHRTHTRARAAARLVVCSSADPMRVEQLNRVFFESPPLDHAALVAAAEGIGMSEDEVAACLSNPANDAAVEANLERLESLGFEGLPTTYLGGDRIVGALPKALYQAAFARAQQSRGKESASSFAFYVLVVGLIFGILWIGRADTAPRASN